MASSIRMAHINIQGVNCAVFAADAPSRTPQDRHALLGRLVMAARMQRLRVEKAALAYQAGGRMRFFGTRDLANYLASAGGVRRWTHTLTL